MDYSELKAYKKSFALAMDIFVITRAFPKSERYALIDQIRRSSRAVSVNLAEAYRKRRYKAHFVSKLTDCDMENSETGVWLAFSKECGYLSEEQYRELKVRNMEIGKLLGAMIRNPDVFRPEFSEQ